MKYKIKAIFLAVIIILTSVVQTGCWNRRELNTIAIVMGVGIDKGKENNEIEMTAQIVDTSNTKSGSGESGNSSAYINISGRGKSVISIFRNFTHEISRKPYISHNQMIIFGNDYAKEGINSSIDFFMRAREARLTVNVFVAKNDAKDIFEADPNLATIPVSDVANRVQVQKETSTTAVLTVMDLMICLDSKTRCAVAPIVDLKDSEDKKIAIISGGAVFKGDKVVGELDKTETRGYLWITDKVKSGIIDIDVENEQMAIEIVNSETKTSPKINEDGTVSVTIKIKESGNISSFTGKENLAAVDKLTDVENITAEYIKAEVKSAIDKAIELNADIFGIGDMLYKQSPKKWKDLENNWDETFKNIDYTIEVDSTITSAGRLSRPNYPAGE